MTTSAPWLVREASPPAPRPPRLLDRVREAIRSRHYSRRTEKAYVHWIRRFIFVHGKRHPAEMGAAEVAAFLTSLAVQDKVAASTQNQVLSALLFLYREVFGVDLPWLEDVVRAKRPQYLPVVLTRDETRALLQRLNGVPRIMALLLYGAGLRLLECCRLRVKDVDFAADQIVIRDGKGRKDRVTVLPAAADYGCSLCLLPCRSPSKRRSRPESAASASLQLVRIVLATGVSKPSGAASGNLVTRKDGTSPWSFGGPRGMRTAFLHSQRNWQN